MYEPVYFQQYKYEQLQQLKHSKNTEMHTLFSGDFDLNCKEKIIEQGNESWVTDSQNYGRYNKITNYYSTNYFKLGCIIFMETKLLQKVVFCGGY